MLITILLLQYHPGSTFIFTLRNLLHNCYDLCLLWLNLITLLDQCLNIVLQVFPTFAALFPFSRGLGLEGIHGLQ